MKNKIILEINGVRHKLIKTKVKDPCKKCSLENACTNSKRRCRSILCYFDASDTRYRKCKPGE